jgi:hypothetical protein
VNLETSLHLLLHYIESQDYRGFDPYDALLSPFFRLPVLKDNKLLRFGSQQLVKRFPLNLRHILFMPKGLNPVTLGLCIQGYSYLSQFQPDKRQAFIEKIGALTEKLESLIPSGYSGACWGYDFDWEARHAKIPAFQPTVVATGIITNALFTAWKLAGLENCRDLCVSAAGFVMKDLQRTYDEEGHFSFSYSPFDDQQVFNASMKGARLLAQAWSVTEESELKDSAQVAVDFVAKQQREDGSWGYSLAAEGGWSDNYHTGYVLNCLDEYIRLTGDVLHEEQLARGYAFYKAHFLTREGIPKFFHNGLYPVDCTAAAQTLLTLCRFGDTQLAEKVAAWMSSNMQSRDGHFYFRKFRRYTIKTSFMRWSNAWMFAGLACLLYSTRANVSS